MPSLPFFAGAEDAPLLLQHLNEDPDLAFLVPLEPIKPPPLVVLPFGETRPARELHRWHAVKAVTSLADGSHTLWHTSSPEPLFCTPDVRVADPWAGWRGSTIVSFDDVHPEVGGGLRGLSSVAIVYLELSTRHRAYSDAELATRGPFVSWWKGHDMLVASQFSWIGGRYQLAPKVTTQWWSRLRRWFERTCTKLTDASTGRQTFYAFPSALALLKTGIKYYAWNWDLDASIRAAPPP